MKLTQKSNGQELEAAISELTSRDFNSIAKNDSFSFDWDIEKDNEVYKIYLLSGKEEILGLMSLIDRKDEYRIHLNLLEVIEEQQGKTKTITKIAGCLISFAASLAIKRGYFGFVSLMPKTELVDHYQNKYGFRQYGRFLGLEGDTSYSLIQKYLADEQ